jgi:hypothetical protein
MTEKELEQAARKERQELREKRIKAAQEKELLEHDHGNRVTGLENDLAPTGNGGSGGWEARSGIEDATGSNGGTASSNTVTQGGGGRYADGYGGAPAGGAGVGQPVIRFSPGHGGASPDQAEDGYVAPRARTGRLETDEASPQREPDAPEPYLPIHNVPKYREDYTLEKREGRQVYIARGGQAIAKREWLKLPKRPAKTLAFDVDSTPKGKAETSTGSVPPGSPGAGKQGGSFALPWAGKSTLSQQEAEALDVPVFEGLDQSFNSLDVGLRMLCSDPDLTIWSDANDIEIELIKKMLIRRGMRDKEAAAVARTVAESGDIIMLAGFFLPRIAKTYKVVKERPRRPKPQRILRSVPRNETGA